MHILQLCPRVPYPPHDGGAIAMYETLRGLAAAGHRVTVLAANTPKHHQPADALDHLGPQVRLVTVDVDTRLRPLAALGNLLFSAEAYNEARFRSPALLARLVALVQAEGVDVVQLEGAFVAWYAGQLRAALATLGRPVPLLVLRAHNVEHTIWQMLAAREANPLKRWYLRNMAGRLQVFERQMLGTVDAVAAITPDDAVRLQAMRPAGSARPLFAAVPASFDLRQLQPDPAVLPRPRTVFMLGSLNWLPNLEGLDWLLREVWPAVHAELPELELHIAGLHPPAYLTSRPAGQDNVFVHGFVASAPDFMRQYELMLVPLLSGGGMRVKIVEGMALGKAIVSTSIGAEGVVARDGHDLVLRDGAAAWQQVLRDYYHGRLPVAQLAAQAARTAADTYDGRRVTGQLEALYERAGAGQGAPVPAAGQARRYLCGHDEDTGTALALSLSARQGR